MSDLTSLAAEVAIVVIFVAYLTRKDQMTKSLASEGHEAVRKLADSFAELKETIAVQNELMRMRDH